MSIDWNKRVPTRECTPSPKAVEYRLRFSDQGELERHTCNRMGCLCAAAATLTKRMLFEIEIEYLCYTHGKVLEAEWREREENGT